MSVKMHTAVGDSNNQKKGKFRASEKLFTSCNAPYFATTLRSEI